MKKNPIDKLFEENLREYSEIPDEKVWDAIEASLDRRKRSRKVLPIWWKLGGVAALLAIFVYLINPADENRLSENPVTEIEQAPPGPEGQNPAVITDSLMTETDRNPVTATGEEDKYGTDTTPGTSVPKMTRAIQQYDTRQEQLTKNEAGNTNQGVSKDTPGLAEGKTQTPKSDGVTRPIPAAVQAEDQLAAGPGQQNPKAGDLPASQPPKTLNGEKSDDLPETVTKNEANTAREKQFMENNENEGNMGKKSIFDEIEKTNQENEQLAAEGNSKWTVGPKIAPVYFNSFGKGSPIHESFVANSKSGNVNFSYGLALSYTITPKLSIRSGVHKVDYGYNTNDISFSPTLAMNSGDQINNINYSLTSRNLVVRNATQAKAAQEELAVEVSAEFPARDGRMVQQFGYVEVPLELDLALVDRKWGVHLIGGLSSLFLIDNSVTLESSEGTTEMGEANNLNSLNFSTNIGLGIQYEISSRILLNLEPVFKYQLNTFSDTAGNFNPYSVGVYSGINFKF